MRLTSYAAGACSEIRRFGIDDDEGHRIAYFDKLEDAAVVFRYLRGAICTKDESDRARLIMHQFDLRAARAPKPMQEDEVPDE